MEESLSSEEEEEIIDAILHVPGVIGAHHLRTRRIGSDIALEVHILVDRVLDIASAHDISTEVESAVREKYGQGAFVSVHVEPQSEELRVPSFSMTGITVWRKDPDTTRGTSKAS